MPAWHLCAGSRQQCIQLLMLQAGILGGPGRRNDKCRARQVPQAACKRMQGLPAIVWHIVVHQIVGASNRPQADPTMPSSSPAWAIARDQQITQQADLLVRSEGRRCQTASTGGRTEATFLQKSFWSTAAVVISLKV